MERNASLFAGIAALAVLVVGATVAFVPPGPASPGYGAPVSTSASTVSAGGLDFRVALNTSAISPGQAVSLTLGEWNSLDSENSVPSSNSWAVGVLGVGPCGPLDYPFGFEVLYGYYTNTSSGLAAAGKVQLYEPGTYYCPGMLSGIRTYAFYPLSQKADLVGSCDPEPCLTEDMNTSATVGAYWTGSSFAPLPPGIYTVVAGDEWGALLFAQFEVVSGGAVIIPAGASFQVSSSYDCVAGHYSVPFTAQEQSVFSGGFNAEAPGVTLYVATAQQAPNVHQGHPSSWVYTSGLSNSSRFSVILPPGTYVAWVEGADLNCGSQVTIPLEQLTEVNVTEAFAVSSLAPPKTTSAGGSVDGTLAALFAVGPTQPVCSVSSTSSPPTAYNSSIGAVVTGGSGGTMTFPLNWVSNGCEITASVTTALTPGSYTLSLSSCPYLGCDAALPKAFAIQAGQTTEVNVSIDTGIR
jgi:hypothetical protein